VGAYIALTKPRIIELLLITTVPAMVLADGGWPGTWLVLATLIGGTLSAGGANAINNYFDRDIDVVMRRTSRRPLPRDAVQPEKALIFGVVLGVVGFVWLWLFANLPAALLATGALLFYVFVYTIALKRNTPQNIVIGGAAGAAPVLVGWAAVTGGLAPPAWILFGIVFCWTPPHFWALALRYKDDYASAGVPMLPVVVGEQRTTWHILGYSVLLTGVSLLLWPVASTGLLYPIAALILGVVFVFEAARLIREPERSMALFRYSTIYLAVLFAVIWVDTAIG
jgi:protoheme IX farnesyltransferase